MKIFRNARNRIGRIGSGRKVSICAGLGAVVVTLLAGCGDFWQSPYGTNTSRNPGCTSNCSSPTVAGVFYVLNQATKQIAAYSISSGKLTKVTGSPYSLKDKPYAAAIAPSGGFLYVGTDSGIFLYTINSTSGALTAGNNGEAIVTEVASTMQVDATGAWLVEAGPASSALNAVPLDSTTGLLGSGANQQAALPASAVQQVVLSPDNGHVFVADGPSGTVVMPFQASDSNPFESSLALTIPAKNLGGSALSVAVDPQNRMFYVGESFGNSTGNSGGLRAFNYASLTSTLVESPGSPYPSGGVSPNAILPISSGSYVYVANSKAGGVAGTITGFAFEVSESAYSLTAGSTIAAGIDPIGLAEESSGNYVLLIDSGGTPDLEVFTQNPSTGALTAAFSSSTGTDPTQPVSIVTAP